MPSTKDPNDTSITLPKANEHFEDIVATLIMTPMGNPFEPLCRWGVPAIFWGLSGLGKSERIGEVCDALDMAYSTILPGQHTPEDFSGAYLPDGLGKLVATCTLPGIAELLSFEDSVVFVDEMSGAAPTTQGAMLGTINDRRSGSVRFPPGMRFLGAANPPEYSAGGWALEAPMANRWLHFHMGPPTVDEWVNWLYDGAIKLPSMKELKDRLLKNWPASYARTRTMVGGFMRTHNVSMLHDQPLANNPKAGYNWPSPRTWKFLVQTVSAARALAMSDEVVVLLAEACVGEGPASEFFQWMKTMDLPAPETVIVKGWKPRTDRLDMTLLVAETVTLYVRDMPKGVEREDAAIGVWKFLETVINAGMPDTVVRSVQRLMRCALGRADHTNAALKTTVDTILTNFNKKHGGVLAFLPEFEP